MTVPIAFFSSTAETPSFPDHRPSFSCILLWAFRLFFLPTSEFDQPSLSSLFFAIEASQVRFSPLLLDFLRESVLLRSHGSFFAMALFWEMFILICYLPLVLLDDILPLAFFLRGSLLSTLGFPSPIPTYSI